MRTLFSAFLSVCALATPLASAWADESAPIQRVVPSFSAMVTTSGRARLEAGLDLRMGASANWDRYLHGTAAVNTEGGSSDLASVREAPDFSRPREWQIGLGFTLVDRNPLAAPERAPAGSALEDAYATCIKTAMRFTRTEDEEAFLALHADKAFDLFLKQEGALSLRERFVQENQQAVSSALEKRGAKCAFVPAELACRCEPVPLSSSAIEPGTIESDCAAFAKSTLRTQFVKQARQCNPTSGALCGWLAEQRTQIEPAAYCESGRKPFESLVAEERATAKYPKIWFTLKASYGAKSLSYFESGGGAAALLRPAKRTYSDGSVGAMLTYVQATAPVHFTAEIPILYQSRWHAPEGMVSVCDVQGLVATDGGDRPAESCSETPFGEPRRESVLWASVLLGLVMDGAWRLSLGPTFAYDFVNNTDKAFKFGFQAPVYVALTQSLKSFSGDYEGLVRVTPSITLVRADDQLDVNVGIAVQLLAKRWLFGGGLDWP